MGGGGTREGGGGRFPFCFCGAGLCKKAQAELDLLADKQRICSHRESGSRDNVDPRPRKEGAVGEVGGGGPLKRGGAEQRRVLMSLFYPGSEVWCSTAAEQQIFILGIKRCAPAFPPSCLSSTSACSPSASKLVRVEMSWVKGHHRSRS